LKDGDRAIGGAQFNYFLKAASAPLAFESPGQSAAAEHSLGLSGVAENSAVPELNARQKLVQYAQQTRFVNGRNFFQNGTQWIDAGIQKVQNQKSVRIQFNSPEYFAFMAKNQQTLPWLALGQNVQFVLNDTIYEIYE
jgi:hypothetical protein